jgi:DNA-directed RNA polymerase specialized sigma24 family protein
MALAIAADKRIRAPLPFPPRRPLPFPKPKPETLPPAAFALLLALALSIQAEAEGEQLGIPGAFTLYWAELRRYGTHYLDLYGHADDAYADGEDIAAAAFLALVERSTDYQTGTHYQPSLTPAPLMRQGLYGLAKGELRAATAQWEHRRPRWVTLLRISDFYTDSDHTLAHPAALPLVFPAAPTPVETGEIAGVEALAPGSLSRTVLAILARESPIAARVLVLRYVAELGEREVADACKLSPRALDGHLRLARKRFAALYRRLS